jgi:hypothetical protein
MERKTLIKAGALVTISTVALGLSIANVVDRPPAYKPTSPAEIAAATVTDRFAADPDRFGEVSAYVAADGQTVIVEGIVQFDEDLAAVREVVDSLASGQPIDFRVRVEE